MYIVCIVINERGRDKNEKSAINQHGIKLNQKLYGKKTGNAAPEPTNE